jgi:chemotaxis protein methyltransferase CheR
MDTTQTKTPVPGRPDSPPVQKSRTADIPVTAGTEICVPPNMAANTHEMDEKQFLFLQQLLTDKTGIRFRDRAHLSRKLGSRLRALKLKNYTPYIELIKKNPGEIPLAIEAITTNETFFFRDFIHLVALEKYLDRHMNATRSFKIWSAASSSGEEVYSIAMTVQAWAAARRISPHTIKIIGSDIDRAVLKRATEGLYHRCQIERTPKDYKAFLLRYLEQNGEDYFSVKPHIKKMVHFKRFNLTRPLPFSQTLDVIFCRNVFLYFNQELRNEIFTGLHRALRPGGLLVMGLCEPMPVDLPLGFTYMGNSMYMKTE